MLLLAAAVAAQVTHSLAGFRDSDAGITKSRHPTAASGASQQHQKHHSHHNADTASHADGSTTTPRKTVIIFR